MTLRGRLEIARTFAEREALTDLQTLHLCTNIDVEVLDESSARVGSTCACSAAGATRPRRLRAGDHALAVVAYEDTYARMDGRGFWRPGATGRLRRPRRHRVAAPVNSLTPHYA